MNRYFPNYKQIETNFISFQIKSRKMIGLDLIKLKKLTLCILILITSNLFAIQQHGKIKELKFLGNRYHRINDTLFACEIEVTNKDYKNFLSYLLTNDYEKCKIDSSLWQSKFKNSYNYPMVRNYHIHQVFDCFPVVNISYYGAAKYCEWLTRQYKKFHIKTNFKFKLPTAQEWILLSNTNPTTGLPYNLLSGKNQGGEYLENIKAYKGDTISIGEDGGYYTVKTDGYATNLFGLYNVIGNAAEMTDIQDIQKGGSWFDDLKDCTTDKVQKHATPDPRVGFRVVVLIPLK